MFSPLRGKLPTPPLPHPFLVGKAFAAGQRLQHLLLVRLAESGGEVDAVEIAAPGAIHQLLPCGEWCAAREVNALVGNAMRAVLLVRGLVAVVAVAVAVAVVVVVMYMAMVVIELQSRTLIGSGSAGGRFWVAIGLPH